MDPLAAETKVPHEAPAGQDAQHPEPQFIFAQAQFMFVSQNEAAQTPGPGDIDTVTTKPDAPPPPPLTLSKSYKPSVKKGDEDYHIGISHIPLIGENRRCIHVCVGVVLLCLQIQRLLLMFRACIWCKFPSACAACE
jgi:hypothetical protein